MFANQYFVNYIWQLKSNNSARKSCWKKKKLKFGSYTSGRNIKKQTKLDIVFGHQSPIPIARSPLEHIISV